MVDVFLVGFSKIEFLVGPKKLLNFLSSFSRQQFSLAFRINFCTTKGFWFSESSENIESLFSASACIFHLFFGD